MMQYSVIRKIRKTAADGKNYNLTLIVREYRETEPQMNADERRFVVRDYPPSPKYKQPQYSDSKSPALDYGDKPRRSTLVTQIKRMFTNPCKSAPSAKSAFYRTDSRTKSNDGKVSAFISVHPRFFYDVTFQGVEV